MSASASWSPASAAASVLGAAAAWLLALLLGRCLLPSTAERDADQATGRLLACCVAGTTLQSILVLALSPVGWLRPLPLVAASLAAAVAAGLVRGRALLAELRLVARAERPRAPTAVLLALPVLAAGLLATLPTIYYDDLVYHLGLPRQALLTGSWPALPGFHYSFMPAGWDAVHALPMALGGWLGPQWRNVGCLALLALAAWRLARRGGARPAAGAAAALLLAAPMIPRLGAYAAADLFVGLAAAVAFERALAGRAVEAALSAGAAWGAKYTGLPVLGATALLLALAPTVLSPARRCARAAGAVALGLALPLAWTLRTWWLTGNPVFPSFWSALGGRHWDALSAASLAADVRSGTLGERGVLGLALAPWDWLTRSDQLSAPGGLSPLYLVLGAAGLLLARRLPAGPALVAAVAWLHVAACWTSLYPRFALPLFVALLPFAAAFVEALLRRVRSRGLRASLALVLAGTCAWGTLRGALRHAGDYGGRFEVLLEERAEVLPSRIGLARAEDELDQRLPADARVLVVGEGRLALLPRRAVASSGYDPSWPALQLREGDDAAAVAACFEGFSHVLVNLAELDRFARTYSFREHFPGDTAELFLGWLGGLEPVARWGPVVLHRNRAWAGVPEGADEPSSR